MGKIKEKAKTKTRDGARWAVRKHPVGRKVHDMYSDRKAKKNRVRGRKPRRRERTR